MEAAKFIGTLMHSRVAMQLTHWDTFGLGTHEGLGGYYEGMNDMIDGFAEKYFGSQGRKKVVVPMAQVEDAVPHLKAIAKMITEERKNYTSDLQNILDDMLGLVHHTLYKLSFKTVQ